MAFHHPFSFTARYSTASPVDGRNTPATINTKKRDSFRIQRELAMVAPASGYEVECFGSVANNAYVIRKMVVRAKQGEMARRHNFTVLEPAYQAVADALNCMGRVMDASPLRTSYLRSTVSTAAIVLARVSVRQRSGASSSHGRRRQRGNGRRIDFAVLCSPQNHYEAELRTATTITESKTVMPRGEAGAQYALRLKWIKAMCRTQG
jgi:hypothetical protein